MLSIFHTNFTSATERRSLPLSPSLSLSLSQLFARSHSLAAPFEARARQASFNLWRIPCGNTMRVCVFYINNYQRQRERGRGRAKHLIDTDRFRSACAMKRKLKFIDSFLKRICCSMFNCNAL